MKITSIPTEAPGWHDPQVPGFKPVKDWTGHKVRVTVPVGVDPPKELAAARRHLEKRYPGAVLHLVAEFTQAVAPDAVDVRGGDEAVLRSYLSKVDMPEGSTVDQVVDYLRRFLPDAGLFGVQGLHFELAEAENVLCFEKVSVDLDRTGLTLVSGVNKDWSDDISNGAGKSSYVSIPFLALFGRTFKGQVHDGWAYQGNGALSRAHLKLHLPDNRLMRVLRTRRPGGLRAWIDDKEVSMAKPELTQALIERTTNLTWEVLTNSVYIGQREIGSVFGTDKERKELFSRLLGLDRFLEAEQKLRKVLLKRHRAVEDVEGEIRNVQSILSEARTGAAELIVALAESPDVTDKDVKAGNIEVGNVKACIADLERAVTAIDAELDKNQKAFELMLSKGQDVETRADVLREQIEAASKVGTKCPTCGTLVTGRHLEQHAVRLRRKLAESEEEWNEYAKSSAANRTVRRALVEKIQEKRQKISKLTAELANEQRRTDELKAQADARSRLEALLRGKQTRVSQLQRIERLHERARGACVEERAFAQVCVEAVGRDGLPAYLCAVAAPQLNAAALRYSQVFTDGEIGLSFDADLNVSVVNPHGGHNIKDQSSGEMRMAAIIAALSFRDVLINHNVLVLDEPSEGLDPVNAAAFARGLNSVVERFKHVIVISHSGPLLEELEPDRHLVVTKRDGVAIVAEV